MVPPIICSVDQIWQPYSVREYIGDTILLTGFFQGLSMTSRLGMVLHMIGKTAISLIGPFLAALFCRRTCMLEYFGSPIKAQKQCTQSWRHPRCQPHYFACTLRKWHRISEGLRTPLRGIKLVRNPPRPTRTDWLHSSIIKLQTFSQVCDVILKLCALLQTVVMGLSTVNSSFINISNKSRGLNTHSELTGLSGTNVYTV